VSTSALDVLKSEGLMRLASSPIPKPAAEAFATSHSGCSAVTAPMARARVRSARNSSLPLMSRILPNTVTRSD
jgi:hypothetical protein